FPSLAFYFTLPEQVALSNAIMRRVATRVGVEHSAGPEFTHPELAPVTLPEFQSDFRSPESIRAEFYRSPAIRRIIDAIDGAEHPEQLAGRERLEALRPMLARLSLHLQRTEGIVLAAPEATVDPKAFGELLSSAGPVSKGTPIVNGAPAARTAAPESAG